MIFLTLEELWDVATNIHVFNSHEEWDIEIWSGGDWRNVHKIWPLEDGGYHISPHGLRVEGSAQVCLSHRTRLYLVG